MRLAATTAILFAALTLATPAPAANSEAVDASVDTRSLAPEVDARAAGLLLESRDPKKSKGGKNKNTTQESAATILTSKPVLELGALGLSVLLWV